MRCPISCSALGSLIALLFCNEPMKKGWSGFGKDWQLPLPRLVRFTFEVSSFFGFELDPGNQICLEGYDIPEHSLKDLA